MIDDAEITIRVAGGRIEVLKDGKTTGMLTWGEMIEQVIALLQIDTGFVRYPMLTPKEWAERDRKFFAGEQKSLQTPSE